MADYNYKIFNKDFDDYFISKDSLVERGMFNSFFAIRGLTMFGSRSNFVSDEPFYFAKQASINLEQDLDNNISVVTTDGKLFCWGTNNTGNIGDNSTITRSSPVQIGSENTWRWVSTGIGCTVAIKNDGTLWTWGLNTWGQLGVNDVVDRSSPVQVGTDNAWRQIHFTGVGGSGSISSGNIWSIKNDGTLWAWGRNNTGGLGLNDTINRSSPTQVGSSTNWKQVCHKSALKNDGTLWEWETTSSPVQIGSNTNWKQLNKNNFSNFSAIKNDGTLWTWGGNDRGQLGTNNTNSTTSPVQVGTDTNWKQTSSGQGYATAIKTDGTVWTWGENDYDRLAIPEYPSVTYRSSPTQVLTGRYWTSIEAGKRTTVIIGKK